MDTQQNTTQSIQTKTTFEMLECEFQIHFPEEWQAYYITQKQIKLEQLGRDIPFGPHNWTCIELDNIEKHCKPYPSGELGRYQIENYVDIALRGFGMGHYMVLSMTKDGHNFFFRRDGGSNGYERMANIQRFQGWNPTLYQPLYSIAQVMKLIKVSFEESFDVLDMFLEKHCQKGDNSKVNYPL